MLERLIIGLDLFNARQTFKSDKVMVDIGFHQMVQHDAETAEAVMREYGLKSSVSFPTTKV
jgi:hypothetical protein